MVFMITDQNVSFTCMNSRLFAILTVIFIIASIFPVVFLYLLDGALLSMVTNVLFGKDASPDEHLVVVNIIGNIIPLIFCYFIYFRTKWKSIQILVGIFMMIFTFCFITFCSGVNDDINPYLKPIKISVASGLFLVLSTQFISRRRNTPI